MLKDIIDVFENEFDLAEAKMDDTKKVIHSVAIASMRESKNGYIYSDKAFDTLMEQAHGTKAFLNHPSKGEIQQRDGVRDIRDWLGIFENSKREGDKVSADLRIRPTHWELMKDVATMGGGIGFSINSTVKAFKDKEGRESIEDIVKLKSVDLVASPALTGGLFESVQRNKKKLADVYEAKRQFLGIPDEDIQQAMDREAFILAIKGQD